MIKKIISTALMCIFMTVVFSQTAKTYGNLVFKKGDFQKYLSSYFSKKITKAMDSLCIQSCTMIRFSVDQKGNVDSVYCNLGTPKALIDLFTEAISSTKDQWAFVNDWEASKSQKILLPICYQFEGGNCNLKKLSFDSMRNLLDFSGKEKSQNSFYYPTNLDYIDCILMGPIYIGGIIY